MRSAAARRSLCPVMLALLLLPCLQAPASPADSAGASGPVWLPAEPLFPRLAADGTGQQLSLNKDLRTRQIFGTIGGRLGIVQGRLGAVPVQLGIGATVNGSFIKTPSVLNVLTVDFFVNLPVDLRLSDRLVLRTGWGHYSAHLADDGVEAVGTHSINYAKDYIPLLAAFTLTPEGAFLYGGARIDYYTIPVRGKPLVLEAGADAGSIFLTPALALYGALDIKCRQEISWGTTQSYQLGLRLPGTGGRAVRVAYTYRTGADERGQFYREHLTCSLMGIYLDF